MKLVCVGDSITAGAFLDQPSDAWPARLGRMLCATGWQVVNAGIGGNAVATPQAINPLPQRLPALLTSDVTHLIIFEGINDVWSVSPTETCNALLACLLMGINAGVTSRIATLTPFSGTAPFDNPVAEAYRQGINAWLRAYFNATPYLADFDAVLRNQSNRLRPEYSYDGLHPNAYGHMRLADAALAAIG